MKCDSPFWVLPKAALEKVPVPCGRCPPCKLRRINGWVFRLQQEEKRSTSAHFVTLTYNTDSVPISENGFMTLRKKDFQDFMKRLRKLCPTSTLKYFACGEYGSTNSRPHYHAIIFNVPDVSIYADAWSLAGRPLGAVHTGFVSSDSIAYTLKYLDKAHGKKLHARDDRAAEFPLMSKSLGANYLTPATVRYHQQDISRLFVSREKGHRVAMPRYYRGKIYSDDDQRRQNRLIQSIADQDLQLEKLEYQRTYGSDNGQFTFEDWTESKRHGRYYNFYHNQKNRDI